MAGVKKQPLDVGIIRDAMEFAADYSAKNCLKPGGFGFEHKLAEMKDSQVPFPRRVFI